MFWTAAVSVLKAIGAAQARPVRKARRHHVIRHHWGLHFDQPGRERMFLASSSFLITFAVIRTITHAIKAKVGPFRNLRIGGAHIHHLVWGIALLHLNGYAMIYALEHMVPRRWAHRLAATGYGAGAAMTLDEFALWLRLEDVYWTREGRKSVDAVFLFGSLLLVGVWGGKFLHAVARDLIWFRDFERSHLHLWEAPTPLPAAAGTRRPVGVSPG
jgi:hypothetical protein